MEKALELIKRYQKEIYLLSYTAGLLHWDQQTYMPKQGGEARAEQTSFIETLVHEKMISNELFEALEELKNKELSGDDRFMVDKLYKIVWKARKLPKEFVSELSKTQALAFDKWVEAKEKSDFNIFLPLLKNNRIKN
jgi:carboxypeptidase Taq